MSRNTFDIGDKTVVIAQVQYIEKDYDPCVGDKGGAGFCINIHLVGADEPLVVYVSAESEKRDEQFLRIKQELDGGLY